MTAPEPTPTAEHTDAVARAIDPDAFDKARPDRMARGLVTAAARDLLASPHWERRLVTPWEVAP